MAKKQLTSTSTTTILPTISSTKFQAPCNDGAVEFFLEKSIKQ